MFFWETWYTVNPRLSPRGLICKKEFYSGGLFEGGGLIEDLRYRLQVNCSMRTEYLNLTEENPSMSRNASSVFLLKYKLFNLIKCDNIYVLF